MTCEVINLHFSTWLLFRNSSILPAFEKALDGHNTNNSLRQKTLEKNTDLTILNYKLQVRKFCVEGKWATAASRPSEPLIEHQLAAMKSTLWDNQLRKNTQIKFSDSRITSISEHRGTGRIGFVQFWIFSKARCHRYFENSEAVPIITRSNPVEYVEPRNMPKGWKFWEIGKLAFSDLL